MESLSCHGCEFALLPLRAFLRPGGRRLLPGKEASRFFFLRLSERGSFVDFRFSVDGRVLMCVNVCSVWGTELYTMHTFTWDSLTSSSNPTQQVILVVSVPNVWGTINKLATQGLQPWASKVFCDLVREVDWCKFLLRIMFGLRVIKTLMSLKWPPARYTHMYM